MPGPRGAQEDAVDAHDARVLWRKSAHPDNHVPSDFLAALKQRQVELARRPAYPSVRAIVRHKALPLTTYISFIALFIALFRALLEGRVGAGRVAGVSSVVGWGAVLSYKACNAWLPGPPPPPPSTPRSDHRTGSKSPPSPAATSTLSTTLLLPPLVLYLLSPLLLSLTKATTSDTIWPLASGLFVLGGLLGGFDGGAGAGARAGGDEIGARQGPREMDMPGTPARPGRRRSGSGSASAFGGRPGSALLSLSLTPDESLRSSLALTSTTSACIVLASRLESAHEVFALLGSVALGMGALIWVGRTQRSAASQTALAATLYTTALYLWHPLYAHQRLVGPFALAQVLLAGVVLVLGVLGPLGMRAGWRWRVR